jgi:hypothetical protein
MNNPQIDADMNDEPFRVLFLLLATPVSALRPGHSSAGGG